MGKKTKIGKDRKDKFYQLAKETGFRSRAAFKLIQLNRKFSFLQTSQVCIDLCAAPGGWMQVAKQNMPVSSIVIGVDLFAIKPIPGCIALIEDITTEKCKSSITKELQSWKADVVLHDGAPNVGRNWLFDAYQQICLTLNALKLATHFLRSGGWFVTKVFRSKDYNALLWVLKQLFKKVHATKPSASRKESAEIFIVCQYFLAPDKIDARLLDPKYVFEELELETKKASTLLHPDTTKRVKAEGYSEIDIKMRNELLVSDFIASENGLAALQNVSEIIIDSEAVKKHKKTTAEIVECCKDIKVLGRKELRHLLTWWKNLREDFYPKESEKKTEETIEPKDTRPKKLTQEELEDMEMEELEQHIAEIEVADQKDQKRKKKKVQKARTKLNEKLNLKMIIKGDAGPKEEDIEVFNLNDIETMEQLESLQDAAPDHEANAGSDSDGEFKPKFVKYSKEDMHLDRHGLYRDGSDSEKEKSDAESEDEAQDGLGFSDDEDDKKIKRMSKAERIRSKKTEHPLITDLDHRDKDSKRKQRVQLWFEKDNLKQIEKEVDNDEDVDLDKLAGEYKSKGVKVMGEEQASEPKGQPVVGKKKRRRTRHAGDDDDKSSSDDSDSESEVEVEVSSDKAGNKVTKEKKKKFVLDEYELALGAMMVQSKRMKRDLVDAAWNRYTFNDDNVPDWFQADEALHMRKEAPVPKELVEEYKGKVDELNTRPLKKVMEAKARKKRRALKKLTKAKKKAEQILENADASAQEKMKQIKKLYKKAQTEKKKEITYVVAKKHTAMKRVRRPPGVSGQFRVVDPRMKKDRRALKAKGKREKKKGGRK